MASSSLLGVFCTCMIIILLLLGTTKGGSSAEGAREFKVGDHLGWHQPDPNDTDFFIQWAERNRFQIGDSLVFEYQNDSVLIVEKWNYFNCDSKEPIKLFDDGNNTITLERSGSFYFISGTEEHCNNGQKLIVEVMSPQHNDHNHNNNNPIISPALPPSSISIAPEDGSSGFAHSPNNNNYYHHSSMASPSMVFCSFFFALFSTFGVFVIWS